MARSEYETIPVVDSATSAQTNGAPGFGIPNLTALRAMFTKEKLDEYAETSGVKDVSAVGAEILRDHYQVLREHASDGPFSYRVACFFAGCAMIGNGALNVFITGGLMSTTINLYQCIAGGVTVGIEAKKQILSPSLRLALYEHFRFLFSLSGRGLFYILFGILIATAKPWTNWIVGAYVAACGVMSLIYGYRTKHKLKVVKHLVASEPQLRALFSRYDTDADNFITIEQFQALMSENFNTVLSYDELEAAVNILDRSGHRKIGMEQFCDWYAGRTLDLEESAKTFGAEAQKFVNDVNLSV